MKLYPWIFLEEIRYAEPCWCRHRMWTNWKKCGDQKKNHSLTWKYFFWFILFSQIIWRPWQVYGGFQLEFVSILNRVINHMTCYKFECSHWWKIYFKKNPLQYFLSSLNAVISTNESTRFITGHMVYNLAYT